MAAVCKAARDLWPESDHAALIFDFQALKPRENTFLCQGDSVYVINIILWQPKLINRAFQVVLVVKNLSTNAGNIRDGVRTLSQEDSLGGRHDSPLRYSCLENSMNRLAWQAIVHRITKSRTQLKRLSTVQHKLINKALQTQRCRSKGRGK